MSVFGPIIGNLPLLHLPSTKLAKLPDKLRMDCLEQIQHNCVRRGWLKSLSSDADRRLLIDLEVGRAHVIWSELSGTEIGQFLDVEMEQARRLNEYRACFGFYLEGEIRHLITEGSPGPVLLGALPDRMKASSHGILFGSTLKTMLRRYREAVDGDTLNQETNNIVERFSGRDPCLASTPREIEAFFGVVEVTWEIIEAEVARLALRSATGDSPASNE